MASALMIDDNLQIDGFNPTTWTGDYGINKNGFRGDVFMDGSYITAENETPMEVNDFIPVMNSTDLAGNIYLKTAAPSVAPYNPFPARKFEYSNGRITWVRPQLPWSWENGGESVGRENNPVKESTNTILILFLLAIVFYAMSRIKS